MVLHSPRYLPPCGHRSNILLQINHFVPDSASVAFEFLERQKAGAFAGSKRNRSFSLDDLTSFGLYGYNDVEIGFDHLSHFFRQPRTQMVLVLYWMLIGA